MSDPLLGRTLGGKFTLESLIGTGAMGSVYRARHVALETVVAVKVMHADIAAHPTFAERFHREARAASRLDHPNVIRVVDFGLEPDGLLYIVMEHVEGYDLFNVIRKEAPLSEARIIHLMTQTLSGVAAAHEMGVVHRDLKPENVMVARRMGDDGEPVELVKVCDFGIAQLSDPEREARSGARERTLTTRGVLLGTPQYMSPEQARGEVTDSRTDVYSLGVILYQLLTGRLPFDGPTPIDTVLMHISEDPVPPSKVSPSVPAKLEAVCMRALAKHREGRWPSARDMRAALRSEPVSTLKSLTAPEDTRGVASPLPQTKTPTSLTHTRVTEPDLTTIADLRGRTRRKVLYAGTALALLGLGAFALWLTGRDDDGAAASARPPMAPPPSLATNHAVPSGEIPIPVASEVAPPSSDSADTTGEASHHARPRPGVAAVERDTARDVTSSALRRAKPSGAAPEVQTATSEPVALDERALATSPGPARSPDAPDPTTSREAPPAVTVAESRPARPQPPPSPVPPSFSVRREALRVDWRVNQVGGGVTAGDVTRAIAHATSSWNACYEKGLVRRKRRIEARGTLRLNCDEQGRIVTARFSGTGMSDVASCVQSTVTGITIPNADTGEAWASVAVTLAIAE